MVTRVVRLTDAKEAKGKEKAKGKRLRDARCKMQDARCKISKFVKDDASKQMEEIEIMLLRSL